MINLPEGLSIAPLAIELTDVRIKDEANRVGRFRVYTFYFNARHRDTGLPVRLEISESVIITPDGKPFGEPLPAMIRRVLCSAMCHEVDEVLQLNGVRIREPHL